MEEILRVATKGKGQLQRACLIDGDLYLFGTDEFRVVKVPDILAQ